MLFLSIPVYFNPTQMIGVELNWEICFLVVTGVGMISFGSCVRTITPLGVLEVLFWDILLSSGWECIWLKIGPLKLGSADKVGR